MSGGLPGELACGRAGRLAPTVGGLLTAGGLEAVGASLARGIAAVPFAAGGIGGRHLLPAAIAHYSRQLGDGSNTDSLLDQ